MEHPSRSTLLRDSLLLAAVTLVVLTSFLWKAVHLDDPLFLWMAEQIQHHPTDFFGFAINWHGTRAPVYLVNKNPPLAGYYFALWRVLGVRSEWAFHSAAIPIALLAVHSVYGLSRRLCRSPLAAAALALATPAFVVSATTLMTDVLMFGWWCLAIWLWLVGLDERRTLALAGAALATALCALTKYFGAGLIPLLFVYTVWRERRLDPRLAWLALPLAILLAYEAYTRLLYGHGVVTGAIGYAGAARGRLATTWLDGGVTALSFTGGSLLAASLLGPFFTRRALPWTATAGVGLALGLAFGLGQAGGIALRGDMGLRWDVLLPLTGFVLAGANVLWLALQQCLREPRNAETLLLALWVFGTFVFAGFLNWTVNARAILPMAPAVVLLALRAREQRFAGPGVPPAAPLAVPALLGLALSLAVARGDEQWALSSPLAAQAMAHSRGDAPGRLFFQGHWGLQFYIEPLKGIAYDRYRDHLRPGDLMVIPANNSNLLRLPAAWVEHVELLRLPSSRWITLNAVERGAGFYSSVWGPLPFNFGRAPEEVYEVQRVRVPIEPAPAPPGP